MPLDPNDPADLALIQAEVAKATKPLQAAIVEANSNLGKLTAERDALSERATKAAADLAAALESGTATAAEIDKLRARVEAADKAEADRAAAALSARVAKLPEAVRGKAPADPAALATWLEIAESVPVPGGLVAVTGAGGGVVSTEPTAEDLAWARSRGYDGIDDSNIVLISKRFGPRRDAERAASGK